MTNSSKRKRGLAFAAILLIPFLCSFTEEGSQSDEYLKRRNYEKILVERFTNNEVSIQSDSSTIYTAKGSLTSYYNGNDLTRVSANLDGFSAPIDVNYQYDQEGSLQRYSNGHITLEKITNGPETIYSVDGSNALSILDKDESIYYTYPDGETVWEEVNPNGQFRVMRNSDCMFEGTDGPDGMLTCNAHHGLKEEWVYDQDGNLGLYNSSDKTFYEKKPKNSSSADVAIGSYGMCDAYSVQEKDFMMTYSNKNGSLISDYDSDSSNKFLSLKSNGKRWDMRFSLRGDKPLDQIGEVSSPYGTYEASFDDNNIVS